MFLKDSINCFLEIYRGLLDENFCEVTPPEPKLKNEAVKKILTLNGLYLLRCYGLQRVQYCACDPDLLLFEKGKLQNVSFGMQKDKSKMF